MSALKHYPTEVLQKEIDSRKPLSFGDQLTVKDYEGVTSLKREVTIISVHEGLLSPEIRERVFFLDNLTHAVYADHVESIARRSGKAEEAFINVYPQTGR